MCVSRLGSAVSWKRVVGELGLIVGLGSRVVTTNGPFTTLRRSGARSTAIAAVLVLPLLLPAPRRGRGGRSTSPSSCWRRWSRRRGWRTRSCCCRAGRASPGDGRLPLQRLCAEDIAPVTDDDVARETAGTFMGDHLIQAYRRVCDLWPHATLPESHWEPVTSDAPTLLLSGGRDPVTPPEAAEAVARHLPNSLHVVVPNGGHSVGGPCIAEMIRVLVDTGSLGAVDPSCVEAAPPTGFRLPGG
ncbi:MAG TPA: alpha/beta fold hydrolase [Longimicrobiales bacterium]|nr:alpha/beta fold hydrolase [Longimicrobiales bacterium]